MTNADLFATSGDVPVVSNSSSNNGISGYVAIAPTENGNMITYSDTTTSDAIFYQPFDFVGYPHVQGLYPKQDGWTERTLLYFISAFKKSAGGQFDYGNKFNRAIAAQLRVILPTNKEGNIDFDFMSSRIRELEEERIRELEAYLKACGFEITELTHPEISKLRQLNSNMIPFKSYKITDIFSVNNTHNILKTDVEFGSGNIPYVTAGEGNNSIASYISYNADLLEAGNSIMIGGKTMVITYQPDNFFSNDSHNLVLQFKDKTEHSENENLFVVAALYRSLSYKYHWGDSISKAKIKSDLVKLPVTQNGDVDFETMIILINAIKKIAISKVKEYINKEHRAYFHVCNSE